VEREEDSMDKSDLIEAARTTLTQNLNLQPGERVLFVTDVPRADDWQAELPFLQDMLRHALFTRQLCDAAREAFPGSPIDFLTFPATGHNGTEPPADAAARLLEYDVLLLMTSFSMTHTDARQAPCAKGARVASMPGIEESMFLPGGPMRADFEQVRQESVDWAEKMTACRQVRVLTPQGTDLTFSVAGRSGCADHGLFHAPGEWGNLPAGEAFIAPEEGTAQGRLVVPAGWYLDLNEDMALTFEDGCVIRAEGGGAVGDHFRGLFRMGEDAYRHRRNCAELGIGTNPNAKRVDNVLEAEKIRGTIHIAVGDSAHMDGQNVSDIHEDFIIPTPTVYFDDQKVMG
jgi:leucyl aminopeptidase (aminopeptidase T)